MRKSLLMTMALFLCILPFNSFGQKLDKASPTLIKSVRKENQMIPVSPEKVKGKPLNSEIYLQTYEPLPSSPFAKAQIGFSKYQNEVSTKLAEELGDETLYANIIYSDTWADYAVYEIPYGIYSFTASETTSFTNHFEDIGLECNAGVYANNKFYGIHPTTFFGNLTGVGYFVINTETWEDEKNFIVDGAGYEAMASNMTFDPTTNTIYALRYNEDLTAYNWATLDTASFTFNNLAAWPGNFSVVTLSTTPDGTIYGIGANGNLYSFDKEDGNPTLIGATGVYPSNYSQSAVYNGNTGKLLWSAITYTGSHMYTVDLNTGAAERLFTFENSEQMVGMFTKSSTAKDNAPAAISDLAIKPDTDGSLNGTVTYTVPTLSYAGTALTGNLTVTTKIDGVIVDQQDLAVGSSVSLPYTLSNNNHTFSVLTSNDSGNSPLSTVTKYLGYDNPKAVSNLNYNITDGLSELNWDAPTLGVYEGYIDPSELYYKVTRLPDNMVVADHLTTTSFSETMPTIMARYSYEVVAYNGSDKAGVPTTTQELVYGDGFVPPYSQTFEDENPLEYFNILDNNADNSGWQLLTGVVAYWPVYGTDASDADDYLITPALDLKAGIKYKLTFSTKALWSPGIESMKVLLGTSQTDISTFTTELWDDPIIDYYYFTDQTVEFSVTSDGKYNIAFYSYSPVATSNGLYIDYLSVDQIGAFNAPAKVNDLVVTPDINDELQATISFTAPTLNLNAEAITDISQIDIYRNDDLTNSVYTFSSPTAGESLSWLDENVPFVGYNKYTVIASNSAGAGELSQAGKFIGVYSAPYSETFDSEAAMEFYTFNSLEAEEGTSNWSYYSYSKAIEGANWDNIANEWVFLPTLKLKPNTVYEFSMDYLSYGLGTFDLTIGDTASPENQTTVGEFIKEPIYTMTNATALFSTDAEGKYVLGLHMEPSEDYWYFYVNLDNIKVTEKASTLSPGAIQNLLLKADENGERNVSITFNAPSEAYNGGTLQAITKIDIYHESDMVASQSFDNPTPGEQLTWTETNVPLGYVKYAFTTQNEYGTGKRVLDSVFVGADIPVALTDITIKADANNANSTISWDAPIGVNNGYIDYSSLTYNIYTYDQNTAEFNLVRENITDTFCLMQENLTGDLEVLYYAVSPVLNDYEAEPMVDHVVLGNPYTLPFKESFGGMAVSTTPWVADGTDYSNWEVTSEIYSAAGFNVYSQDNDEGMIFFYNSYSSGSGYIEFPKVELYKKNVASNVLRFWVYQSPDIATQFSYLNLEISADDNAFEALSDTIHLEDGSGWTPHTINLDDYKTAQFITIRAKATTGSYAEAFLMDNVNIYSVFPEDLSVSNISGPASIIAAEDAEYAVGIQNVGSNDVLGSHYTISLYNEDQLIETKEGIDLNSEATASINFTLNPDVTEVGSTWELNATIDYSADQVTSNNVSNNLSVSIEVAELPIVDNLSALESEGEVLLNWTQPNIDYEVAEVEGFENHTALTIDNLADWKTVDLDGQYTSVVSGLEYLNAGEAMAYQIWNIADANANDYSEYLSPHSGNQCIISWSSAGVLAADESPVDMVNNDWLISKEITPGSKLAFWTKQPSSDYGNETFEIWASSASDAVEDFILVDNKELLTTNWIYYTVQLPDDAKYFAIHHTSSSFALMIDDIELIPVNAEIQQYNLLGYNVYRNNIKMNDALVTETTFTDTPDASNSYTYTVNVSYEEGESALSNTVIVDFIATGINPEATQNGLIIGGKGQMTIKDLQGKNVSIYTIDGTQVDAFVCISNNETRDLTKGIYVVTVENKELSTKVIVY